MTDFKTVQKLSENYKQPDIAQGRGQKHMLPSQIVLLVCMSSASAIGACRNGLWSEHFLCASCVPVVC